MADVIARLMLACVMALWFGMLSGCTTAEQQQFDHFADGLSAVGASLQGSTAPQPTWVIPGSQPTTMFPDRKVYNCIPNRNGTVECSEW